MEQKTKVHRWVSKTEYYDIENGEEIRQNNAKRNYDILRTIKQIKIINYVGHITYIKECEKKRQQKLWK